jgi:hypothetical protein
MSCSEYVQLRLERNNAQNAVFASWIWGYMAGFNMEAKVPTQKGSPDEYGTLAHIDKHCREHPLDPVIVAANALIRDLGGIRRQR